MSLRIQDPETAAPGGATEPTSWIEGLAAEPALVQLMVLVAIVFLAWVVLARLGRLAREARARAAVRDYLLGVEQALSGDLRGATKRLERVLSQDPENAHARLLYGLVLADLGETGEAHKQHVQLHRGFGVDSLRNDLALARLLLEVGRPSEAVEPAERAVARNPTNTQAHGVLFRAQLAAGYPEDAGHSGVTLARLMPRGAERDRVTAEAVRALSLAADVRLRSGDTARARALAATARGVANPEDHAVALLDARLILAERGEQAMWDRVRRIATPEADAGAGSLLPALRAEPAAGAVTNELAAVIPPGPYVCSVCGAPTHAPSARCSLCGARDACEPVEPQLFAELESPVRTMDAIEVNRTHVQLLCCRVLDDDVEAAVELVELSDEAVEEVLAAAIERGADETRLTDLLQRMGPGILGVLFDAYRKRREDWRARFGELFARGSTVGVIGRVVQGFGREALPHFEGLIGTADRDLRKIIIDYYIGLADAAELDRVIGEFPPVEVIHRLNDAPAAVLEAMLRVLERDSLVAEVLLTDPGFDRSLDVIEAMRTAGDKGVLVDVLRRRGLSRATLNAMVERFDDEVLRPSVEKVLDSYGTGALTHLVSAFADLDRPPGIRSVLGERLERAGADAIGLLCDCFGDAATPLDADIVRVCVAVGAPAVAPLGEAYLHGSVLEKMKGPFAKRHTHRRTMIVRAITAIGGRDAQREIERLCERESDQNLKLRLAQALHRLGEDDIDDGDGGAEEGGDHGQVG